MCSSVQGLTCLYFRVQKDGSLKVYIDNVSRASYETSQYCVSFTDLPSMDQEMVEGNMTGAMMEGNITAVFMEEDPDFIQDCSDIFTNLHNLQHTFNHRNVETCEGDISLNNYF